MAVLHREADHQGFSKIRKRKEAPNDVGSLMRSCLAGLRHATSLCGNKLRCSVGCRVLDWGFYAAQDEESQKSGANVKDDGNTEHTFPAGVRQSELGMERRPRSW